MKGRGDVSPKKSLVFTTIKSEYLRRLRPSEQIFTETNLWGPLIIARPTVDKVSKFYSTHFLVSFVSFFTVLF